MITIGPLKEEDIPEIYEIEKLSFAAPKEASVFRNDRNKYLVAKMNRGVVGYIGIEDIAGEKHVVNMAVHPDERRMGIGEKLIETILDPKAACFLEVRVSNTAAQNLYEKYGFQKVGRRKNYYADNGEDALIMRKDPNE
ncbi:MAG: ribosomal protein S18-alanine N-acetyltransferase [Candidatus Margulisiibacteriota bacterium]|nr:ribosomal protein S18-alanine N-acetyltransferase [Candidatus Margulisiibacteriota bacterium]